MNKYHLGDQIVTFGQMGPGECVAPDTGYNVELLELFDIDFDPLRNGVPDMSFYIHNNYSDLRVLPTDKLVEPLDAPKGAYATIQFDSSFKEGLDYTDPKWMAQWGYCPTEKIVRGEDILEKYDYINYIDVGNKNYSLAESAWLMKNAEMHIGICSGMAWLAVVSGQKNIDIWYNYDNPGTILDEWKHRWTTNNANIKYLITQNN